MLIGIDGNEANVKKRVGSNIYCYELLKSMQNLKRKMQKPALQDFCEMYNLKFKIYLKEKPLSDLPKETSWWQYRVCSPKKLWTQIGLPLALYFHRPRPGVFFTPGHYAPRWSPCPTVISIMDLSYICFPVMFRRGDLWQLRRWTAYSVKKAKAILTISEFSKNAIIKYYHINENKIVVTYPGVKKLIVKNKNLLKKYSVDSDYILYVGSLQPRKNLLRLIEAYNILLSQYPDIKLVIVGKKGWLYEDIFKKVRELKLERKVIFTGYVPDEDLPAFYQNAQCFVLVSLYEGFGLPVLEAMNYGCPVVASNVSSLPEVVGQAGVLVNPENVEEIAQGIKEAIKKRKTLVARGLKQAKKFSWEKCARETLGVLEKVAKSGRI